MQFQRVVWLGLINNEGSMVCTQQRYCVEKSSEAGAKAVLVKMAGPESWFPYVYGVGDPNKDEVICACSIN